MLAPARSATILVVEDDPDLRELYREVLTGTRRRVVAVDDGLDALRFIDGDTPPDVVVLDLELPYVSGWDVYHDLRSRRATKHLPVIVVTGNSLGDIQPQDLASLLLKPIEPEVLIQAVEKALASANRD